MKKIINNYADSEKISAEMYDVFYRDRNKVDVQFYLTECANRPSKSILELGCGTGRILFPLANQGYSIDGVDKSPERIKICKNKILSLEKNIHKNVRLFVSDMLDFNGGRKYDLITIPFRGYQHLITVEQQRAIFLNIWNQLAHNGYLIFDIFDPSIPYLADDEYLKETETDPIMKLGNGETVRKKWKIVKRDYFKQVLDCEEIFYITNNKYIKKYIYKFKTKYTFKIEIELLLEITGFTIEKIYSSFKRIPYGKSDDGEIIVIAKKK